MSASRDRLNRSESLHQQVARNLRNDIESGALRHGQALPSSRELAEEWGVSVFTITEAMKILAEEGLVISQSRSKRVVNAPDQTLRNDLRMQNPRVVIVGGYAGSGKTELGRILARETGWPMLDKDTLTRPVVEAALEILGVSPHDRESDVYVTKVRPREYESLIAAIDENLMCGNSVIATAPFIRELNDPAWIARVKASFAARNASTVFVWVYCDADTMHMYIRRRGAARDAAKLADWPGYLAGIDVDFRPAAPHHVIDNSASSEPLQSQARDLLKAILDEDEE
ncbi:GntR family transcriptional regulator [Thermomonospora cellulosilytica]|uniref:DNA-binding transcriptional regulator YhcF (GntR family) n=1 Tax=Thermomonospora cellulosilytica TaxID=1411118 RepID=A0A7W3MUF1_9ACTN|nr:GntR family transcriptional regulator [Thermomonospora cellulosilytica]MBA9002064.1 DNA-binding transcriptional regulator YhcF (GntR family) [Thermomonospora cellulosilytica]